MTDWLTQARAFSARPIDICALPAAWGRWVELEISMTRAINEHFDAPPQVRVHFSGVTQLLGWERELLGIDAARGFARHITLEIAQTPVLLARSITEPGNAIEPLLSELQQTPLARVLFEDTRWQRQHAPTPLQLPSGLYGRACTWRYQPSGERLVVEEFFNFTCG